MEWYLAQIEQDMPVLAVRYADLTQAREMVIRRIFAYCDLPLGNLQQSLCAFACDSQAGTPNAREHPSKGNKLTLTKGQIQSIMAILQRHPVLNHSDFIAPEMLKI